MKTLFPLFIAVALLQLAGCSGHKDADLMSQAQKLGKEKKFQESLKLYQEVVDEYPDSKFAPQAWYGIGLIQLNELKNPQAAIRSFMSLVDKTPGSEYAHRSLFLTGFVYANNLNDFHKAKQSYERYLRQYPDSSMAETARFELANLGRNPDDILKQLQDSLSSAQAAKD